MKMLLTILSAGINDDLQMIRLMCQWISEHDLANNPLHFSRFFPRFKIFDKPVTPVSTLKAAQAIASEEGLRYIYLDNV